MTIDEIKELIHVLQETGIAELELQRGENRVRIRRATGIPPQDVLVPTVVPMAVGAAAQPVLHSVPSANAALASNKEPATPAMTDFANMRFSP